MNEIIKENIEILQNHLADLRKIAGWTAEELAQKLGVTKQNISMLENNKNKMTQTQYIAIRFLFDSEAFLVQRIDGNNIGSGLKESRTKKNDVGNEALQNVLKLLFDNIENYKCNRTDIDTLVHRMAISMSGEMDMDNEDRNEIAKVFMKTLGVAVAAPAIGLLAGPVMGLAAGAFLWTTTILKLGKKK